VYVLDEHWKHESQHQDAFMDVFRISSYQKIPVKLKLSMLAKNLLTEEYPLAEKYITKENDNTYIFETEVASLAGVGRFVLGLVDEIKIHYPESLREYVKDKVQQFWRNN
jgi:predicted DNA-binding transcriptional regulator YafY